METWITLWTALLWASAIAFFAVTVFIVATSVRGLLTPPSDGSEASD